MIFFQRKNTNFLIIDSLMENCHGSHMRVPLIVHTHTSRKIPLNKTNTTVIELNVFLISSLLLGQN